METTSWVGHDYQHLVDRAVGLLARDERVVLGIAGAPACGKSTLASALLVDLNSRFPGAVVLVGMDAFHIGHRVLECHGLVGVKGAPETFDAFGYAALLSRIRTATETIYAPEFHRDMEDSLAHVVEIGASVRLVITEGNYLLLPQPPWDRVRGLLDEAWFVHLDDAERQQRMLARHQRYGHSVEVATAKTHGSDEANARLVNEAQNQPDLWIEHLS